MTRDAKSSSLFVSLLSLLGLSLRRLLKPSLLSFSPFAASNILDVLASGSEAIESHVHVLKCNAAAPREKPTSGKNIFSMKEKK